MEVEVRYYASLREITQKRYEKIKIPKNSSIRYLIDTLVEKYGQSFQSNVYDKYRELRKQLSYVLNGVNINNLNGVNTLLEDDDVFSLLPVAGGG